MILAAGAAALLASLLSLLVWRVTGDDRWVVYLFRFPGAFLLVGFAAIQLWYSWGCIGQFSAGQPIRRAWILISWSAAFNVAGTVCIQILSVGDSKIRDIGHLLDGTCRYSLLAAGLWWAVRAYQQSGLLARLTLANRLLLGLLAVYIAWELQGVVAAIHRGKHLPLSQILNWPVDPLLCLLLAQALLLYRSNRQMGDGYIGRCWMAISAGIFLICMGDVSIWAAAYGYLPWPWSAVQWFVWLPAAAAFAVAPIFQLDASYRARATRGPMPSLRARLR
ncbi:MAG TPA: hypothetical protein VG456_25330 [Candidatus Sulfopaludibacter sp.]|nr:hypothetical protein [Candidatus Sulfopaludibacter sp.]